MKVFPATLRFVAIVFASVAVARAGLLKNLPGGGEIKKSGYTVRVSGGEEGDQEVHYDESGKRKEGPAPAVPAVEKPRPETKAETARETPARVERPAPAKTEPAKPAPSGDTGTVVAAGVSDEKNVAEKPNETVDPVVGRYTGKESDLAERGYERKDSASFGKGETFDKGEKLTYDRWGRADEKSRDRKTFESFGTGDKFDTGEAREKNFLTFDKRGAADREMFGRGDERAEITSWTERFSSARNGKFVNDGSGSSLRDRMATGYTTLMQVSMQDIGKTAFRRNHSSEKGDLPVGKIGAGPGAVSPLSKPKS